MALATADFATAWIGDGTESNPNTPSFSSATGLSYKYEDITGQPTSNLHPEPNVFICKVTAEESVLDALDELPNTSELPGTREIIQEES